MNNSNLVGTKYIFSAGIFLIIFVSVSAYKFNLIDNQIIKQSEQSQKYIFNTMYEAQQDQENTINKLSNSK